MGPVKKRAMGYAESIANSSQNRAIPATQTPPLVHPPPPLILSLLRYSSVLAAPPVRLLVSTGAPADTSMATELAAPVAPEAGRIELKSYDLVLPMASLSIGVDNIHHDVFLSPKFVQGARDYL